MTNKNSGEKNHRGKYWTAVFLIVAVIIGLVIKQQGGSKSNIPQVVISLPNLSDVALQGEKLFEENCMACHGKDATGSNLGPPFIHKIYEPNHHGDQAFVLAALRGVRAHHWTFGNMPPQPQVNQNQVMKIVRYVRELQRANGIN